MAKKPKTPPLSPERVAMLERIITRMKAEFEKLDLVMTIDGMHTLPHLRKEGGYRHLPVDPSQEFLFKDIYIGARGQVIFCFTPADDQDYERIEVDEAKMDSVFPLAGPAYAAAIGQTDEEDMKILILATEQLLLKEDQEAAAAEAQAKVDADVEYTQNPLFGRF